MKHLSGKETNNMKHINESIIGRKGITISRIELQDGDVVVLRNNRYMVVCGDMIHGKNTSTDPDEGIAIKSYNHNLIYKHKNRGMDIMAIYRFTDPDPIDPGEQYVSSYLKSFVTLNLKGMVHYGINRVFERK